MIGDTIISGDLELEVVWSGGEGLVPDRPTKPDDFWTPPHRLYNKKAAYWSETKVKKPVQMRLPFDKPRKSEES